MARGSRGFGHQCSARLQDARELRDGPDGLRRFRGQRFSHPARLRQGGPGRGHGPISLRARWKILLRPSERPLVLGTGEACGRSRPADLSRSADAIPDDRGWVRPVPSRPGGVVDARDEPPGAGARCDGGSQAGRCLGPVHLARTVGTAEHRLDLRAPHRWSRHPCVHVLSGRPVCCSLPSGRGRHRCCSQQQHSAGKRWWRSWSE